MLSSFLSRGGEEKARERVVVQVIHCKETFGADTEGGVRDRILRELREDAQSRIQAGRLDGFQTDGLSFEMVEKGVLLGRSFFLLFLFLIHFILS